MSPAVLDLNADLHAHSTWSDGTLTPAALVERALARGVDLLALTDHDEIRGLPEAVAAAAGHGLAFVPGVEISVTYAGCTVHVVGLGIDPADPALAAALADVRRGRDRRARDMAAGLAAAGIPGTLAGALRHVANPDLVSRTHFARHLVERGVCADTREVFRRFLTEGKPGFVPHRWAELADAVRWIRAAGGQAVLAHPGRYALGPTATWALYQEFRAAGGVGIEICTGSHAAADVALYAKVAHDFGFEGSRGSDFHEPDGHGGELGRVAHLPYAVTPVWHRFVPALAA